MFLGCFKYFCFTFTNKVEGVNTSEDTNDVNSFIGSMFFNLFIHGEYIAEI